MTTLTQRLMLYTLLATAFSVVHGVRDAVATDDTDVLIAQTNSVGGTLGRGKKDLSGGKPKQQQTPAKRKIEPAKKATKSVTRSGLLNGRWRAKTRCNTGTFTNTLRLTHSSPDRFSGSSSSTSGLKHKIFAGRVKGRSFSLKRRTINRALHPTDRWQGTISADGKQFTATARGSAWTCKITASRI